MEEEGITPWERRDKALHADCRVYKILKERWSNRKESLDGDFFVMEVGDWAVTIALTEEGNCVLVRQFRFGTEQFSWELPAGVVDPGEDPAKGGERELYEESGYRGSNVIVLGSVHPNPAIQRNTCHFILVEGARKIDSGDPGEHEFFEVREVSVDTLFEWARDGTITHGIVHAALFYLRDHLEARGHSGL
jgi:8-oxo-dGTP pyrophosphatase MutT (NUDIX family)